MNWDEFGKKAKPKNNLGALYDLAKERGLPPEREAEAARLATETGLPKSVVETDPDRYKFATDVPDLSVLDAENPATAAFLADGDSMAQARDDIPLYKKAEQFAKDAAMSFPQTGQSLGRGFMEAFGIGSLKLAKGFGNLTMGDWEERRTQMHAKTGVDIGGHPLDQVMHFIEKQLMPPKHPGVAHELYRGMAGAGAAIGSLGFFQALTRGSLPVVMGAESVLKTAADTQDPKALALSAAEGAMFGTILQGLHHIPPWIKPYVGELGIPIPLRALTGGAAFAIPTWAGGGTREEVIAQFILGAGFYARETLEGLSDTLRATKSVQANPYLSERFLQHLVDHYNIPDTVFIPARKLLELYQPADAAQAAKLLERLDIQPDVLRAMAAMGADIPVASVKLMGAELFHPELSKVKGDFIFSPEDVAIRQKKKGAKEEVSTTKAYDDTGKLEAEVAEAWEKSKETEEGRAQFWEKYKDVAGRVEGDETSYLFRPPEPKAKETEVAEAVDFLFQDRIPDVTEHVERFRQQMIDAGAPKREADTYAAILGARARTWAADAPGRNPGDWFDLWIGGVVRGKYEGAKKERAATLEQAAEAAGAKLSDPADVAAAAKAWAEQGTESPWFKRWSGRAPVVGIKRADHVFKDGEPVVVEARHGTGKEFEAFSREEIGRHFGDEAGFFFTNNTIHDVVSYGGGEVKVYEDATSAGAYAKNAGGQPAIMPVYVRFKRPKVIDADTDGAGVLSLIETPAAGAGRALKEALAEGYDGIIAIDRGAKVGTVVDEKTGLRSGGVPEMVFVASDPGQIKSVFNRGTFDESGRILYQPMGELPKAWSKEKRTHINRIRNKMAKGLIDENSKEFKNAFKKYGHEIRTTTIRHEPNTRFLVGKETYYGVPRPDLGDTSKVVTKDSVDGKITYTEWRTKDGKLIIDGPVFSKDKAARMAEIEAVVKKNLEHAQWYEDWNKFVMDFSQKGIAPERLMKYIKMQGVLSAGKSPQDNMLFFNTIVKLLDGMPTAELERMLKDLDKKAEDAKKLGRAGRAPGVLSGGFEKVSFDDSRKIARIWLGKDPELHSPRDAIKAYGKKVGPYLYVGLMPGAEVAVIDRHMPRPWGYSVVVESPGGGPSMRIHDDLRRQISDEIIETGKKMGMAPSAVQAAIWYETRPPDLVASTYRRAAMLGEKYLPEDMRAATLHEPLNVLHYRAHEYEALRGPRKGDPVNTYSKEVERRMHGTAEGWDYVPLVLTYVSKTTPEDYVKAKNPIPHLVSTEGKRIYDTKEDLLGINGQASKIIEKLQKRGIYNVAYTNVWAKLIKDAGYDGFFADHGKGNRWVALFGEVPVKERPIETSIAMSEVVESIVDVPQSLPDLGVVSRERGRALFEEISEKIPKFYPEIKVLGYDPTVARFPVATGDKMEYGIALRLKGPGSSIRAAMAHLVGLGKSQRLVYVIESPGKDVEANGSWYEFKIRRDVGEVALADVVEKLGVREYNVAYDKDGIWIRQFVLNGEDATSEVLKKLVEAAGDKETFSRLDKFSDALGSFSDDPKTVFAEAAESYREHIVKHFGETEGGRIYEDARNEGEVWKVSGHLRYGPGREGLAGDGEGKAGRRGDDRAGLPDAQGPGAAGEGRAGDPAAGRLKPTTTGGDLPPHLSVHRNQPIETIEAWGRQGAINAEDVATLKAWKQKQAEPREFQQAGLAGGPRDEAARAWSELGTDSPWFRRWFGKSKALDDKGKPLALYHETTAEGATGIRERGFDTSIVKARAQDEMVPDGIFMKPTEKKLGLGGKDAEQLTLYARIENPAVFKNREELVAFLGKSKEWRQASHEAELLDRKYSKAIDDFSREYQKNYTSEEKVLLAEKNEIYRLAKTQDGEFLTEAQKERAAQLTRELFEISTKRENALFKEGSEQIAAAAAKARKAATEMLRAAGHDGVRLVKDKGSFGREVETWIAFDKEQVKSATENVGTFDESGRIQYQAPSGEMLDATTSQGKDGVTRITYRNEMGNVVGTARLLGETIGDIEVKEKYRRQGIGTQIMQDLMERGGRSLYAGSEAGAGLARKVGMEEAPGGSGRFAAPERMQGGAGAPRASIKFNEEGVKALITFFEGKDPTSMGHEVGHLFLEDLRRSAKAQDASDAVRRDWDTTLAWLGAKDGEPLTREQHEKFARGWERYLTEGRAPTVELRSIFGRLQRWFVSIYKTLRHQHLEVGMSEEMRKVFDRLLATEEEIGLATEAMGLKRLFVTPGALPPEREAAYREAYERAHLAAAEAIKKRRLRDHNTRTRIWTEEAEQEALGASEQALFDDVAARGGVSKKDLEKLYGEAAVAALKGKGAGVVKKAGRRLDDLAEEMGVRPEELFDALTAGRTHADVVSELVRKKAIAYDAQVETDNLVLTKEYEALLKHEAEMLAELAGTSGKPFPNVASIKEAVRRIAFAEPIRKIGTAEESSIKVRMVALAKGAAQSYKAGRLTEAAEQKAAQASLAAALREHYKIRIERDAIVRRMKVLSSRLQKEKRPGTEWEYAEQARALLVRFAMMRKRTGDTVPAPGFGKVAPRRPEEVPSLYEFIQAREGDSLTGESIVIAPWLFYPDRDVPFKELTMPQLRDVFTAAKWLVHQGKLETRLIASERKANIDAAATEIVDTIRANNKVKEPGREVVAPTEGGGPEDFVKVPAEIPGAPTRMERLRRFFRPSALIKPEFIFRQGDGGKPEGPVQDYLLRPLIDAAGRELVLWETVGPRLKEIFDRFPVGDRRRWGKERIAIPQIPQQYMTREQIIMAALNSGNEGNINALRNGWGWDAAAHAQVLNKLTPAEWALVKDVWALIETIKPELAKTHKALNGVPMGEVVGAPLSAFFDIPGQQFSWGNIFGQYFPLVWDYRVSRRAGAWKAEAEEKNWFESIWRAPKAESGMTMERKGGKLPPLLSFSVIHKHLADSIHLATHGVALRDVYKLVQHPDVRAAMEDYIGRDKYKEIVPWMQHLARPQKDHPDHFEPAFEYLRRNTTTAILGLKATVALKQLGGFAITVQALSKDMGVVAGHKHAAETLGLFMSAPKTWIDFAYEKSAMMRGRRRSWDREIRDAVNQFDPTAFKLQVGGRAIGRAELNDAFMSFITTFDLAVSYPTWVAGYRHGMQRYAGNERRAIQYADQLVRNTQGSSHPFEMSAWQRGSALKKIFTPFYTFFNLFANRMVEHSREWKEGKISTGQALSGYMWLVLIPAIYEEFVSDGMSSIPGPKDILKSVASMVSGALPVVRDVMGPLIEYAITGERRQYRLPPWFEAPKSLVDAGSAAITIAREGPSEKRYLALLRELNDVGGYWLGYPSKQVMTTAKGMMDLAEGKTENPLRLVFPEPKKER